MSEITSSSTDDTSSSEFDSVNNIQLSNYRWVVLVVFSIVSLIVQVLWITYAPITVATASIYNVSENAILMLSFVFMLVYVPMNFVASYSIDKLGLRWGTGIGVILVGIFGMLRAFFLPSYVWALICMIGIAIGQPFVLNSFTKLATNWFPEKEKALASGISTMMMLLGAIVAFILTPLIFEKTNLYVVLLIYGIASLVSMVIYIVLVKDKPEFPPNPYSIKNEDDTSNAQTLKFFKNKDFNILFILVLIGLGVFNAISTEIDVLFNDPSNISASGNIGGSMIIGGIIGAIIFSGLSDKFQKRKIFLTIAMAGGTVFTLLIWLISSYISRLISAFFLGFFLVSALPIGLTFAAEITYPAPEEQSNGLIMWIGQISGMLLIGVIMLLKALEIKYHNDLIFINYIIMAILFAIGTVLTFLMNDLDQYKIAKH